MTEEKQRIALDNKLHLFSTGDITVWATVPEKYGRSYGLAAYWGPCSFVKHYGPHDLSFRELLAQTPDSKFVQEVLDGLKERIAEMQQDQRKRYEIGG